MQPWADPIRVGRPRHGRAGREQASSVIPVAIPLPGLSAMRITRSPAEILIGLFVSSGAVALVTAVIGVLKPHVPLLSLGALYVFAVLPVAVVWGIAFAIPVAIGSMLAFNWFFLPPTHTFTLSDSANWLALAVYLVTAVVVSELAAGARRRALIAEQRERESALLAEVARFGQDREPSCSRQPWR